MMSLKKICAVALAVSISFISIPVSMAQSGKTLEIVTEASDGEVGKNMKLKVVERDSSGRMTEQKATAWFAIPSDVAGVDESGTITFFTAGAIKVGAIVNGKPVLTSISVKPARIARVEINSASAPIVTGGAIKLNAVARIASGDPRSDVRIDWTSDNPSLATVDPAGLVTGIAPGRVKLRATAEGTVGTIEIEVVPSPVRKLALDPRTKNARTGDVVRFSPSAYDASDGMVKNPSVRWSVSGEGATVYEDGAFVAERPGSYVVTATSGDQIATASIVVTRRNVEREIEVVGRAMPDKIQSAEQWIWGNYAYLSTIADRLMVYDISNPAKPKLTDTLKFDAHITNDVSVTADGKIGVMSREGASNRKNGIVFFDTSDPAHPKIISEYTETVTGGVHSAFIDSHYVYLTDDATGSMRVIDFKDVKNPKEVARWEVPNPLAKKITVPTGDVQIVGRYLHDVQVVDGLAYLAYWRDGLVILDVGKGIKGGSPEKPQLVSQFRFNHNELYGDGWLAGSHAVFRYKNYVFVGDEVFPDFFDVSQPVRFPVRGIVHIIDVSDILNPRKVAEYEVPEGGSHNIWVKDDMMYMGYYSGGARVVDVSGELRGDLYRQGREIARLWTGDPKGFRANQPFTWGAQPHGDMIFFNDINTGLWITKLGKPKYKGSASAPGY